MFWVCLAFWKRVSLVGGVCMASREVWRGIGWSNCICDSLLWFPVSSSFEMFDPASARTLSLPPCLFAPIRRNPFGSATTVESHMHKNRLEFWPITIEHKLTRVCSKCHMFEQSLAHLQAWHYQNRVWHICLRRYEFV